MALRDRRKIPLRTFHPITTCSAREAIESVASAAYGR
jgi:hypothetical protein